MITDQQLLRDAALYLQTRTRRRALPPTSYLTVLISELSTDEEIVVRGRHDRDDDTPLPSFERPPSAGVLPFSPTEERVIASLTDDWQTAKEIAKQLNMLGGDDKPTAQLYYLLNNLDERRAVESHGKAGYRLRR